MHKAMRISLLTLTVVGLLFLGGCNRIANPVANLPEPTDVHSSTWYFSSDLIYNRTIDAGGVYVAMTYDYIWVRFLATSGYPMSATHVAISTTRNGLPHDANGLRYDWFPYSAVHSPTVQEYIHCIPMTDAWRSASVLYVAAHATINSNDAWGRGPRYPGNNSNWSMYMLPQVPKCLKLPSVPVRVQFTEVTNCGFGYAPTKFHVWNVPSGYEPVDGYYPSFCLDLGIFIYPQAYNARLWSSYDPTMPAYVMYKRNTTDPIPYDEINYLINVYGGPPYDPFDIAFLQHIFWYWRGELQWTDLTGEEQSAVNDADLKGIGWVTHPGDYFGVLMEIEERVQLGFLVLDP